MGNTKEFILGVPETPTGVATLGIRGNYSIN
jgi:hypothetical protein